MSNSSCVNTVTGKIPSIIDRGSLIRNQIVLLYFKLSNVKNESERAKIREQINKLEAEYEKLKNDKNNKNEVNSGDMFNVNNIKNTNGYF